MIYKILNLTNGKVYVGQTTNSLKRRLAQHFSKLKNNNHPNKKMQEDYNNGHVFDFAILRSVINDNEKIDELERFFISKFNSTNGQMGYNRETGGRVGKTMRSPLRGIALTKQHRESLTKAKSLRSYSDIAYRNSPKVPCLAKNILNGQEFRFDTYKECASYLGVSSSAVRYHVERNSKLLKKEWTISPLKER